MAGAIQSAGHTWIQFVFARFDCTAFLRAHMSRLDGRFAEINRGEYTSWRDEITGRKPRKHPELGYDLTSSYRGLKKHAMAKMQGAHRVEHKGADTRSWNIYNHIIENRDRSLSGACPLCVCAYR